MYLVDTNVVSELRKIDSGRANPGVAEWFERSQTAGYLSAITMFELERGVRLLERRDRAQGALLREWLDARVPVAYQDKILPVDSAVARLAAAFHVPDPAPERDAYIGATALVHDLTVATRNTDDFARFPGVRVFNPWT